MPPFVMRARELKTTICAIVAICGLHVPGPAHAQALYKSIGKDGVVTYSDYPPADGKIEKVLTLVNLPRSELPAPTASRIEQLRKSQAIGADATSEPASRVRIFTATWCGYCKRAKAYLNGHNIAYDELDIETPEGLKAYAQAGGGRGVPWLIAGNQHVLGFSERAYESVLHIR